MKKLNLSILCALFITLAIASHANDTSGIILKTGNITFTKQPDIKLETEALYITSDNIEVNYLFKNTSDKDITETIFFPLPPFDVVEYFYDDSDNMDLQFKCFIDGKEQPVQTYFTIKSGDTDITRYIKDLLPKYYTLVSFKDLDKYISALPKEDFEALKQAGAIKYDYIDEDDENLKGWTQKTAWKKDISFSWRQTFPAGKIAHIKHTYIPSSYSNSIGSPTSNCLNMEVHRKDYADFAHCPEPDQCKYRSLSYLEYILKTAANWQMPVTSFNLLVQAEQKSAGCFQGKPFYAKGKYFAKNLKDFIPTVNLGIDFLFKRHDEDIDAQQDKPAYKPAITPTLYKIDGPAAIRQKPNGKKTASFDDGSYVWVIDKNEDWYRVIQNDTEGWTYKDNIIDIFRH